MGIIKTYDQFVNENLLDALNGRKQIAELQSLIINRCQYEVVNNPKRFDNGKSVLKYMETYAEKKYKEVVTAKFAMSFSKWWEEFSKNYISIFNELIEDIENGKIDVKKVDEDEFYDPEEPEE